MLRWFEQNGPEGDVVISSRVRLARNLKDYNFSLKLDTPDAHKMIGEAAQKLRVLPEFKDFHEYHFDNLEEVQREAMKERHVISPFLLSQSVAGGFVSSNEDLSIMLNEEDHIRIQAYRAGMDMERAYEAADHIDDCIGAVLPYAYDTQYGYLTTCPSNVGTGMRVSYMCHLPALAWNNKIQGIAAEIGRFGLVMHSVYSDGNKSAGDIYQIYIISSAMPERRRGGRLRAPGWWPSWRRSGRRSGWDRYAPSTRSRSFCRSRPTRRRA